MRIAFSVVFLLLIAALTVCSVRAKRSAKAIGKSVSLLNKALIPPVIGNLIIICSSDRTLSTLGCYIYYLGMDMVMYALLQFTFDYCATAEKRRRFGMLGYVPLGVDVLQLLLNPIFHHAFSIEPIMFDGAPYYRLIPYLGQAFHRVVDYGILAVVIGIFVVKMIRSPRINSERYSVITASMVVITIWESSYIFSRTPVDRAMIGFGVFGILVYYLALYYRPLRLLDSMLANMASEMPEALFFFDAGGQCIWANRPAMGLVGISSDGFEQVPERLEQLFGDCLQDSESQREVTSGDSTRSYVLERHSVADDRQRPIGSFLSVRDNTLEQQTLQREIYKATHDSLTDLYNRAGYDLLLNNIELKTTYLLLIDADAFKDVNDTHGHEVGDRMLKKIADTVRRNFRADDFICRIGGDEFVVVMVNAGKKHRQLIVSRIERINAELGNTSDGLPPMSVSVGIAHGGEIADSKELFDRADQALYETKRRGKHGYTFYEKGSAA